MVTLVVQWPGVLGMLALLAWTVVEAAAASWKQLVQRPELAAQLAPGQQRLAGGLAQLAEAEAGLDPATLAFMQHALPPLPVLLLGLVLQEGAELVSPCAPAVDRCLQCGYSAWCPCAPRCHQALAAATNHSSAAACLPACLPAWTSTPPSSAGGPRAVCACSDDDPDVVCGSDGVCGNRPAHERRPDAAGARRTGGRRPPRHRCGGSGSADWMLGPRAECLKLEAGQRVHPSVYVDMGCLQPAAERSSSAVHAADQSPCLRACCTAWRLSRLPFCSGD